jgi:rubrerythrin
MKDSFSGQEILGMALQIEQKGYKFYELMLENAKSIALRDLFAWLKSEEKKHIDDFKRIISSIDKLKLASDFKWERSQYFITAIYDTNIFSENVEKNHWFNELSDEVSSIQFAISFEKDSILFLEELRGLLSGTEDKIICDLIQEDKAHIVKLLHIKNSLLD